MVVTMLNSYGSAFVNRTNPSDALSLELTLSHTQPNTVTVLAVMIDPPLSHPTDSNSQGSNVVLPNGNHLVDYGQIPIAREYGPVWPNDKSSDPNDNDVRWQARFGEDNLVQNYRMFKQHWKATPTGTKPSLVVDAIETASGQGDCRYAYASWNGATSIKMWKVYEGHYETELQYTGELSFRGFETKFVVGAAVVQVVAVLEDGAEYRSEVVSASRRPGLSQRSFPETFLTYS